MLVTRVPSHNHNRASSSAMIQIAQFDFFCRTCLQQCMEAEGNLRMQPDGVECCLPFPPAEHWRHFRASMTPGKKRTTSLTRASEEASKRHRKEQPAEECSINSATKRATMLKIPQSIPRISEIANSIDTSRDICTFNLASLPRPGLQEEMRNEGL